MTTAITFQLSQYNRLREALERTCDTEEGMERLRALIKTIDHLERAEQEICGWKFDDLVRNLSSELSGPPILRKAS